MKHPDIKAKNSSGKQTLEFVLYDSSGTPEYMDSFDKEGALGQHDVCATVTGNYNGRKIQLDFNPLVKKQVKKFIKRLKKLKNRMK